MTSERGLEAADRAMRPPDRPENGDAPPLTALRLCAGRGKSSVVRLRAWSGGYTFPQDAATRAVGWTAPVFGVDRHLCASGPVGRIDATTARREAVAAAISPSATFAEADMAARRS